MMNKKLNFKEILLVVKTIILMLLKILLFINFF